MWRERTSFFQLLGIAVSMVLTFSAAAREAKAQSAAEVARTSSAPLPTSEKSDPIAIVGPGVAPAGSYLIGRDDVLSVHVWHQPDITSTVAVRPDGKISMPLIGEVEATGVTPIQLQERIAGKLRTFVKDPEVVVVVQQVNSKKFNILGEVQKPGSYPLTARLRVLDAIALGGGFRDFAGVTKIYVLRNGLDGEQHRIKFNYKQVIHGEDPDQNIELKPGDTIIVP